MASLFHWQWLVKYQHIYDGKMSLSKMPIIFVEIVYYFFRKCDFFWREIFLPYFLQWHKCLSLVRYYLWRLNKKPSELLTLVTALVHRKYKIYIFYGVSICDKQSSIVNIKRGYYLRRQKKYRWHYWHLWWPLCVENTKYIFFMVLLFTTNIIPSQINK